MNRSMTITLPDVLSIEGDVNLRVNIKGNSDSGERSEAEWNNTATTATGVTMKKTMQLVMPTAAIGENKGKNVRLQLRPSTSAATNLTGCRYRKQ